MSDLIKKVITIASVEIKEGDNGNKKFKIKDEKGLSYTFNSKKADGAQSRAYSDYLTLGNAIGMNVEISYKENPGEVQGKPVTYRNIAMIKHYSNMDNKLPIPQQSYSKPAPKKSDEPNWNEIALGKIRHGVAVAFIENKEELNADTIKKMDSWVTWIMEGTKSAIVVEDLPVLKREEDDVDLSSIPF